jgi:predicted negative regulator of RcsB-dependent stress response
VDRAQRRELKHDKFVERVGYSVEYASEHREQFLKWGGAALAVIIIAAGVYYWMQHQERVRQQELGKAMDIQSAQIGTGGNAFITTFPTQEAKDKALEAALKDLANKYPGKREGVIGRYMLGVTYADRGNLAEAEKYLKEAAESGEEAYASQAKFSLAQLYMSTDRPAEAEKLLRPLIANPTIFVSKEQATVALAKALAKSKPDEARKLLEPLRTERGPVSRAAITALGEIPAR